MNDLTALAKAMGAFCVESEIHGSRHEIGRASAVALKIQLTDTADFAAVTAFITALGHAGRIIPASSAEDSSSHA